MRLQQPGAPKFTVLIGSGARRTAKRHSDTDIVRIGHQDPVSTKSERLTKRDAISYIDYDEGKFLELYHDDSLFLYHIFTEGVLLRGERRRWESLKLAFSVSTNFAREISENRGVLEWLQQGTQFEGATVPYLAHTFRALKNLAIFLLAEKQTYVFEKRTALQQAFPDLEGEAITLLINANNRFERDRSDSLPSEIFNPETVIRVRTQVARAIDWR